MFFSLFNKKETPYTPNQRATNYIGCTFLVEEEIESGIGKIKTSDNSLWDVKGANCPVGTHVKVVGLIDNSTLEVKIA
ncbi:MAG: NfeD family protein [Methylococcales bacterium]|nr:NfeD family protein [Methylococcales bacterium]